VKRIIFKSITGYVMQPYHPCGHTFWISGVGYYGNRVKSIRDVFVFAFAGAKL
jgi:hypothetical protein